MKKYAVIVAAGSGLRMGSSVPKQFLLLRGKPVLWYTITAFLNAFEDLEIILVVAQTQLDTANNILKSLPSSNRIQMVTGGETRFHSVKKGLSLISDESIIFIHDGVRCLVTQDLIHRCYEHALQYGSAIPVVDCKDSVRLIMDNENTFVERSRVKLVQTPQTFKSEILLPAYAVEYKEHFTDEAIVVETFGHKVQLIDGDINNIKITTAADMIIAEEIAKNN